MAIKSDKLTANILEIINDFKDDTSLQNALENKDKAWLTDIMLHRHNMSMHMYGFNTEYLLIKGYDCDKLKIFFDENLNIKSAYYCADDKEYSINIDYLK